MRQQASTCRQIPEKAFLRSRSDRIEFDPTHSKRQPLAYCAQPAIAYDCTPCQQAAQICLLNAHYLPFSNTSEAVFKNRSRAAHWSPLVHCTMKMAIIPVLGFTDKSVP